jgi:histone acetyltransferase (RNA polymerase elongator complex component)
LLLPKARQGAPKSPKGCSSSAALLKFSAPIVSIKTCFQVHDLTAKPNSHKPFIIPIFLPHAGCPHRCVFCDQSLITGVRSTRPQKDVCDQIEAFLKFKTARRNRIQIAFFGGNFLGMPADKINRLLAEAAEYVKSGRVNSIRFSTRPDTIDRRRLDLIKNFPVSTIELGVQSMDERVLSATKRGHSALETEKAIERLKELKYEIGVQLMVGLPGDTPERSIASAQRVASLKPDFIRIYPTVVLAGSPLADWYRKGDYVPLSMESAVSQTKKLYLLFKNENIRVIRMGLQASVDLENGSTILAGPYHPAFGHLVYSEVFLDMAIAEMESSNSTRQTIRLHVHPRSVSKMSGLKNRNIETLRRNFNLQSVEILPDESLKEDQILFCDPVTDFRS